MPEAVNGGVRSVYNPAMPRFFATPAEFRKWLERYHATERELIVGFYRKGSGRPSITWPESVEQALCFGWIDGVRRKIDAESYTIRFTPRKPTSIWSNINTRTMERLIAEGLAAAAGLTAYQARDAKKTGIYAFERAESRLTSEQERSFRKNAKAWKFFEAMPPWYRRTATHWVVSAKQETTRARRLEMLIVCSAKGLKIPTLRRPEDKQK